MNAAGESASGRTGSLALLLIAEIGAMSLWFVSAAILPEMTAEADLAPWRAALLSSAVQIGFVAGALALAVHGTADRFDPRRVFALSAALAGTATLMFLIAPIGGWAQVALRAATGFCLAGVYPVGMKIAVGWTVRRRGLVVGLLVAALTLGSGAPHGLALIGGPDWRTTVTIAAALALVSAGLILLARLGPHHAKAARFDPGALALAWRIRGVRLAIAGYLCHMWELYAFWAWIAVALAASFQAAGMAEPLSPARLGAFAAIALGGLACAPAGALADRFGKARIAGVCLAVGAASAIACALSFGGPPALTLALAILWGIFVIPDSAQFSALVADAAPADRAGSLMTLQTALGFLLTAGTIQAAPMAAAAVGWPATLALFGLGPLFGVEAMRRLHALRAAG